MQIASEHYPRVRLLWNSGADIASIGEELGLAGDPSAIREAIMDALGGLFGRPVKGKAPKAPSQPSPAPRKASKPAREQPHDEDNEAEVHDGIVDTTDSDDLLIPIEQRRRYGRSIHEICKQPGDGFCRWPVGEVGSPDFFFCGAVTGETYCSTHARRASAGRPEVRRFYRY